VVIVEDSGSVFLDVVSPNRSLHEAVASTIGESIQGLDQLKEFISGGLPVGISEVFISNVRHQHVALIPPAGDSEQADRQKENNAQSSHLPYQINIPTKNKKISYNNPKVHFFCFSHFFR
jgi:hypothetical protein